MPTLIQSYKKQEASARLKKFYSIMNQAILLSENDNGPSLNWKKTGFLTDTDGNYDYISNGDISVNFFLKYLAPYMKYLKIEDAESITDEEGNKTEHHPTVYFADGSSIAISNSSRCMDFNFDINGKKQPNKRGVDIFVFLLCNEEARITSDYYCESPKKSFCAYFYQYDEDHSREKLLENCKNNHMTCSGLLQNDNWEFKEDYPYKL